MRTLIAALLMAASAWAQTAQPPAKTIPQQGPPPKNLTVRPDGHVSANQDPANSEQFEVHSVIKGETLSGIADDALKNPRLWPQLWEENEHIVNPHWIYPDDKILIRPSTPITEAKPPEGEPEVDPEPGPTVSAAPPRRTLLPPPSQPSQQQQSQQPAQPVLLVDQAKPVPEIKFNDLYCSGSVRTARFPENLKVISKFDPTGGVLSAEGEYVYLSQGSNDKIEVGSTYQVVRPTKTITNPKGRSNLGLHYLDVAQMRVVLVQPDFALARVVHSCADAVDVGDTVIPFQPIVVPMPNRPRPLSPVMTTTSGIKGTVVSTKDVMLNFASSSKSSGQIKGADRGRLASLERGIAGDGDIVYVDIGEDRAVNPGDVFIVYRDVDFEVDQRLYNYPKEVKKLDMARRVIGELIVVKVGERAATAVVTYASDGVALGDAVERR